MKQLQTKKIGVVCAIMFGGWHILWIVIIFAGIAQPLLDWIFWLHMIRNPYRVESFDISAATLLIIVTSVVGYAIGWIIALIWNKLNNF